MKIGTGTKVTIGIIGIIAAGIIGVLISTHQLDGTKAGKGQIAATREQGGANAPGKLSDAPADEDSKEQGMMDKDEEEGRNAMMETLDEMAETPDAKTTIRQSGTPQTASSNTENSEIRKESSRTENSETSQDYPKIEYHESYDTFISFTKEIKQTKAEIDRIEEEMEWMVTEWKRSIRDPENPTEEERAEIGEEVTPLREEHAELSSDLNSFADELISEIEAVAPGAIQTKTEDMSRGDVTLVVDSVSIDYEHIQSELGSSGERIDGYLSEFFAGFEVKSIPSVGYKRVSISDLR